MSDTVTDFYHQKTDAELLYFLEHPEQYQPSLVEAARRELQRRGKAPVVNTAPYQDTTTPRHEEVPTRSWGRMIALGLGLLVLGGGSYWLQQRSEAQQAELRAREEARRRLPPPKLTEVATSAIPNYDGVVTRMVTEQLNKVPASEKANPQHLRQFRLLSKLFWRAQTQSEYLINQAYEGDPSPSFADQTLVVRQTWDAWNQAAVYTYKFGPEMQERYTRMQKTASHQQHILDILPKLLPNRQFLQDDDMTTRTKEVQDLVGYLTPISPVTGQRYRRTLIKMKLI
ncbi:hypothetical protein [Hymenobacter arizonensis]|uniref:hypothetical protein n=1 Tax=Hymenobacter arizonensis TaxID=1227077 RepID=UPI000B85EB08|nr:hypothetical protein [Hymenobacter arizonensis]